MPRIHRGIVLLDWGLDSRVEVVVLVVVVLVVKRWWLEVQATVRVIGIGVVGHGQAFV
jgi:hypothetical protein